MTISFSWLCRSCDFRFSDFLKRRLLRPTHLLLLMSITRPASRLRNRGGASLYPPDVAIDNHPVSREWFGRGTAQDFTRAYVELRAVKRTRHRRSVEFAFAQWTLPVR